MAEGLGRGGAVCDGQFRSAPEILRAGDCSPIRRGASTWGHVRNYTMAMWWRATKRAMGFNVLHPMGWDAFGLPAENAARDNKVNPRDWTYSNIETMKGQLKTMGLSLDWAREFATCDPSYYLSHQQRLFLDFWKGGLVERRNAKVKLGPPST